MKKGFIYSTIALVILTFSGCGKEAPFPTEYEIGVLYSTEYKNTTRLVLLDENMNSVYEKALPYGYLGHCGYMNAIKKGEVLYECPQGTATEKELGLIIGLDTLTGEVTEYDFQRVNMTDFDCDENYLYVTSNLNNVDYVERMDQSTGQKDTIELPFYVSDIAVNDGRLYGFGENMNAGGKVVFYLFDFETLQAIEIADLSGTMKEPAPFIASYKNKMYWAQGDRLYCLDTETKKIDSILLTHEYGFNVQVKDQYLWLVCTNIYEEADSYVLVFDCEREIFVKEYSFPYSVQQLEITGNALYMGSQEFLEKYTFGQQGDITFVKRYDYELSGEYYLGGFYVIDDSVYVPADLEDLGIEGMESMTDAELNEELIRRADEMEVLPDKKE